MSSFPPYPLFHYTTSEGFLSLSEAKSLLFSHINFQNDSNEFYYGLNLIKDVLSTEYKNIPLDVFHLDTNLIYNIYLYQLTAEKDSNALWNEYCPNGGYSYSIDNDQLQNAMTKYYLQLQECIYDPQMQKNFIKSTIIEHPPIGPNSLDPHDERFPKHIKLINRNILNYAAVLKDPSFAEKKEWRIIPKNEYPGIFIGQGDIPPHPRDLSVKFREYKNRIYPYWQVPLTSEAFNKIALKEVVISPTQNKELSYYATELLVNDSAVHISNSNVPHRTE